MRHRTTRVQDARGVLTWLLAWTRLIADEDVAVAVANQAVARAASGRKRLTGHALRVAARDEAARLLARGVAAVPDGDGSTPGDSPRGGPVSKSHLSRHEFSDTRDFVETCQHSGDLVAEDGEAYQPTAPPTAPPSTLLPDTPDHALTPAERLARALGSLAPYERLACVASVLDGASAAEIAQLLGVPHERAAAILSRAYPVIAGAVGELERPDFAAVTGTQVEVVVR